MQIFPEFKEANNPSTSPERLRALANMANPEILHSIAGNPNTPPDILYRLLLKFPYQVCGNPVFPLIQMENPAFLTEVDCAGILKLLELPDLPKLLVGIMIYHQNREVIKKLLQHHRVEESHLEILIKRLAARIAFPDFIFKKTGDHSIAELLLERNSCTIRIKRLIAQEGGDLLQYALAENCFEHRSDISTELLESLSHNHFDIRLRSWLMATTRHARRRLASNLNISSNMLTLIAQSNEYKVLDVAALHPNTPPNILEKLAIKGNHDISLIQNPRIPNNLLQPILARLSNNPRFTVRRIVARHHQTPQSVLAQLATDPEPKVSIIAKKHLIN